MARPLRIELAGGLYHVTSRGDRREEIYRDDQDRMAWNQLLGEVCERFNWRVHAYCQMTNHYHVVVETPEGNLSKGMRHLNGVYTQRFNRRHDLVGHLFQGRFKGIVVERDAYLLELSRYVVLNPVRAGMVTDAAKWTWSSYRAMLGQDAEPPHWLETDWILGQFSGSRPTARTQYAAFVAEGIGKARIWGNLRYQVFLGTDDFIERCVGKVSGSDEVREVPRAQRRPLAKPLSWYQRNYSGSEAMARAFKAGVYTMQEIAEHFGVHYSTVSRAVRRLEQGEQLGGDA